MSDKNVRYKSRRAILASISAFSVSGCLSSDSEENEGSRLGHFFVENRHEDPHSVTLKLTWEGEVVLNQTYDLAAKNPGVEGTEGALPERSWPLEPGQFVASARLDGGEWRTADPADHGYPECFSVAVEVRPYGELALWTTANRFECEPDTIQRGSPGTDTAESP